MAETKTTKAKPAPAPEYPDTPSGRALADIGGRGPEPSHDNLDEVNKHAEAYAAAKRKYRWG